MPEMFRNWPSSEKNLQKLTHLLKTFTNVRNWSILHKTFRNARNVHKCNHSLEKCEKLKYLLANIHKCRNCSQIDNLLKTLHKCSEIDPPFKKTFKFVINVQKLHNPLENLHKVRNWPILYKTFRNGRNIQKFNHLVEKYEKFKYLLANVHKCQKCS